jgi:SAM-dependent methyltransferase
MRKSALALQRSGPSASRSNRGRRPPARAARRAQARPRGAAARRALAQQTNSRDGFHERHPGRTEDVLALSVATGTCVTPCTWLLGGELAPGARPTDASLVRSGAAMLAFADGPFALVACSMALMLRGAVDAALGEIRRVRRPDGAAVFLLPGSVPLAVGTEPALSGCSWSRSAPPDPCPIASRAQRATSRWVGTEVGIPLRRVVGAPAAPDPAMRSVAADPRRGPPA